MAQDAMPMVAAEAAPKTYRARRRNFADVAALAWFVGQIADQRAEIDELEDKVTELDSEVDGLRDDLGELQDEVEEYEADLPGERVDDLVRLRHAIVAGRASDYLHELERVLSGIDPAWSTRV